MTYLAGLLSKVFHRTPILTAAILVPVSASAQWTVYDPANYVENVLHYTHQLVQIRYQVQQLNAQLQAMRKLASPPWRDIRVTESALNTAMQQGNALTYVLRNAGQQFGNTFPVNRQIKDWPSEEQSQNGRTVATMRATLDANQAQNSTIPTGLDRLTQMKAAVGQVQGHEQALELQNTATVFNGEELMLLRQAVMAQSNAQAVYFGSQANAEIQRDASIRNTMAGFAATPPTPADESLEVQP
jgi:P-type conjugative transfer protein TrbJ